MNQGRTKDIYFGIIDVSAYYKWKMVKKEK